MERTSHWVDMMSDFIGTMNSIDKQLRSMGMVVTRKHLLHLTIHHTAPAFYVSTEQALYRLNMILSGKSLSMESEEKNAMYQDLFDKYCAYINENGECESKWRIIEKIINSQAPRFYISEKEASRYISRYFRQFRRK